MFWSTAPKLRSPKPLFSRGPLGIRTLDVEIGPILTAALCIIGLFVFYLYGLRAERLFSLSTDMAGAPKEDLRAFWHAGQMALAGRAADLYQVEAFRAGLPDNGQGLLFLNPPHAIALFAPLGALNYGAAKLLFLALTAGCLVSSVLALRGHPLWALALFLSPAMFAHLLVLQLAPALILLLILGLHWSGSRPLLAGAIIALITIKPQFGVLVPVFLIACGYWRTVGWTIFWSMALVGLSIAAFGLAPWSAYLELAPALYTEHGANLHRDLLSWQQTAHKIGFPISAQLTAQLCAIVLGGLITFFSARRFNRQIAIAMLMLCTGMCAPSFWVYDWLLACVALIPLAAILAKAPLQATMAALLWSAPLIPLGLTTMESAIWPPIFLAIFTVLMLFVTPTTHHRSEIVL